MLSPDGIIKNCSCCEVDKPMAAFNNNKAAKDGKAIRCRECSSAAAVRLRKRRHEVGVYRVTNLTTGISYVGGSKTPRSRLSNHKAQLRGKNPHACKLLQAACDEYGVDDFEYVIVESAPYATDEQLRELERNHIIKAIIKDGGVYNGLL